MNEPTFNKDGYPHMERIRKVLAGAVIPSGTPDFAGDTHAVTQSFILDPAYQALMDMVGDMCRFCAGRGVLRSRYEYVSCKPCLGTGKVLRDISQLRPGEFTGGMAAAVYQLWQALPPGQTAAWAHRTYRALSRGTVTNLEAAKITAEALEKEFGKR